jgi:hypothetical protein
VNTSVKWKGREVQYPVLRVVRGTIVALGGLLPLCGGLAVGVLLCALSPLLAILHFILKAMGRRGFITRANGDIKIDVSSSGFHKV